MGNEKVPAPCRWTSVSVPQPALPVPARFGAGQRGAIATTFIPVLLVMLGIWGFGFDLARGFNRKVELQGVAKAVAIAAARELDGTADGIDAALVRAEAVAQTFRYQYGGRTFAWSAAAITFSSAPSGAPWVDSGGATGAPSKQFYVKVDTSTLDPAAGSISLSLMRIVSTSLTSMPISDRAIAGRASINMTPLAVCAMSLNRTEARANPGPPATNELVEYGFRRGVGYDLMQLNFKGTAPEHFLVDPISTSTSSPATNTSIGTVGPFVCSGTMWMPRAKDNTLHVIRPFPIGSLHEQLNSRFEQYPNKLCDVHGAPPDYNVHEYKNDTGAAWMNPPQDTQSADKYVDTANNKLWTIADADPLSPPSVINPTKKFGPLWTYAKAVQFAATEPATGYVPFETTDWPSLYKLGMGAIGYPSGIDGVTPYETASDSTFREPSTNDGLMLSVSRRRVLNVALLECPVPAGASATAKVLGVGQFFMTVPATPTSIYAEFAGLAPDKSLIGPVELYP